MWWLRMGSGHQKDQPRDWEDWVGARSQPDIGGGEWTGGCVQAHDQCFNQSGLPNKNCTKAPWSFLVGDHINVLGWWHDIGNVSSTSRPPMCLFIWLVLICILYTKTKTVIVSIVLSWVLWVILVNYWPEGIMATSKLVPSWSEMWPESEVRAVFLGTMPFNLWSLWKLWVVSVKCIAVNQMVLQ